jgi:bacterioferritin (cytochrome b1)
MCIQHTPSKPGFAYKDMSTSQKGEHRPALLHAEQLHDIILMSGNLPQLEDVEEMIIAAELVYGEDAWAFYAARLAKLLMKRRLIISKGLLAA